MCGTLLVGGATSAVLVSGKVRGELAAAAAARGGVQSAPAAASSIASSVVALASKKRVSPFSSLPIHYRIELGMRTLSYAGLRGFDIAAQAVFQSYLLQLQQRPAVILQLPSWLTSVTTFQQLQLSRPRALVVAGGLGIGLVRPPHNSNAIYAGDCQGQLDF